MIVTCGFFSVRIGDSFGPLPLEQPTEDIISFGGWSDSDQPISVKLTVREIERSILPVAHVAIADIRAVLSTTGSTEEIEFGEATPPGCESGCFAELRHTVNGTCLVNLCVAGAYGTLVGVLRVVFALHRADDLGVRAGAIARSFSFNEAEYLLHLVQIDSGGS